MCIPFHRQRQQLKFVTLMNIRHGINHLLNTRSVRYSEFIFEESSRTECQKQRYYSATERWREIKIALMNKLAKVKFYLRSQLSDELCKPITDHKSFIEIRDTIELLVMVKMGYGLPYKVTTNMTIIRQQLILLMRN